MHDTQTPEIQVIAGQIEIKLEALRQISRQAECGFLAYLIEMAIYEASDIAHGRTDPTGSVTTGHLGSSEIERLYMLDSLD